MLACGSLQDIICSRQSLPKVIAKRQTEVKMKISKQNVLLLFANGGQLVC